MSSTLGSAIDASASALDAQRVRMEVAVSNLANAESTRSADGQPYRRREVVLESNSFAAALGNPVHATGVRVAGVLEDQSEFRRRYEPSHPDASRPRPESDRGSGRVAPTNADQQPPVTTAPPDIVAAVR